MAVILFKKMLRDIRTSLSAYILCILIVAIGLCGYSVLGLCYDNMVLSRDTFFRNTDYCDGFADTADTDLRAASRLEGLDGVSAAEGRLVQNVELADVEGEAELQPCLVVGGPDEPAPAHKRNDAWGGKAGADTGGKHWQKPEA